MRTLIETSAPSIELSTPKELTHGMKLYRIQSDGPFCFKMSVRVCFTPSNFQGSGEEDRVGIVLSISPECFDHLKTFSSNFQEQLCEKHPDIGQKWSSSLKDATDKYSPTLKAKINVKGSKQCQFFDMSGQSCKAPENWRQLEANVVVRLGGVWVQSKSAGVLFEVSHLQFDPQQHCVINPFA